MLYNGLGRYDKALAAASHAGERLYEIGSPTRAVADLIEAAAGSRKLQLAGRALRLLAEMTRASGTDWALGTEARSRALLSDGETAESLYDEAIERLSATSVRLEMARTRLLYGEWLRRQRRRAQARQQLRYAHTLFTEMGAEAFAARAERALLATGERARRRTVESRDDLTAQEAQIARLAQNGLSNPEIAARLFISPHTVDYHLRKVFSKLGIHTRKELEVVLPGAGDASLDA
jgi:DNA-binding CsgD family transcriptional regulator